MPYCILIRFLPAIIDFYRRFNDFSILSYEILFAHLKRFQTYKIFSGNNIL